MTCFVSQLYKMNSSIAAKLFCRIQLQRPSFKVFIGTASSEWVTRRNGFSTRIQAVNFSGQNCVISLWFREAYPFHAI